MIPFLSRRRCRITVGIPVYNDEEHVRTCLDSVLAQSMDRRDIEVICVDDGSTDSTPEVLADYATRFPRGGMRVLTQANSGSPARGRNRMIDEARGEYLYFVDSDDYLGREALSAVCDLGDQDRADVVIGKFVGVGRGVPKYIFRKTRSATTMEETTVIDSLNVLKAFRTEYVRRLPYRFDPSLVIAEDHPFAMSAYLHTDAIAIHADVDCYYCVRHTSEASKAKHMTGHIKPVGQYYAYYRAVFDVIRSSTTVPEARRRFAETQYWNRLLTFDLVVEFRRKRSEHDARFSLRMIDEIASEYGAYSQIDQLKPQAALFLSLIGRQDLELVRRYLRTL
jgi:poly(ribitol-phosphate) beta-N-acetylglucosaminyltransferase